MKTKLSWAAVAILSALVGCGSAASGARTTMPVEQAAVAVDPTAIGEGTTDAPSAQAASGPTEMAEVDLGALPAAPWASERIAREAVPAPLVRAWEAAENREVCAPVAPRSFGAATGARARVSELHGGWAVEFDRRGLPGVDRDGVPCERCGRGVFGIAGTSLMPEDLVAPESDARAPLPTYNDGSYAELEIEGEGEGAAATVTIVGQGCVYEVWSFLGPEHVEELVGELRLVELPADRDGSAVATAD